jgi:protein TonB
MTVGRERRMGVARHRIVGTALAASILVHATGFAALAALSAHSMSSRAQLPGREQVVQLVASLSEPRRTPEQVAVDVCPTDPPKVIEPVEATIAKRSHVLTPTVDLSAIDVLVDANSEPAPRLPQRVTRDDVDVTERPWEPTPPTVQDRQATPRMPKLAVVEPPSNLGNTDETPPDLSQNAPPPYPTNAILRRWEGTVLLRIWLDETGCVTKVEVAGSSGHRVLDTAAVTAVRGWKAIPASRGGKSVATTEFLPVDFNL